MYEINYREEGEEKKVKRYKYLRSAVKFYMYLLKMPVFVSIMKNFEYEIEGKIR